MRFDCVGVAMIEKSEMAVMELNNITFGWQVYSIRMHSPGL